MATFTDLTGVTTSFIDNETGSFWCNVNSWCDSNFWCLTLRGFTDLTGVSTNFTDLLSF